jgi:hypothetical protein
MQKQFFIFSTFLFLSLPTAVSAATISLQATPIPVGVGDMVRVSILLDSTIAANAFSGTLLYSAAALEPVAISDGSSIINLWITRPVVSVSGAPITFVGITPGGFSGTGGVLFSVLFRTKTSGVAHVSLKEIEVLRNDGAGGKEPVITRPLALTIGSSSTGGGYTESVDEIPPESFTIYQGNDSQLFDGRNYLVFMAVDKNSGVDHYAVAESRVPAFLASFLPLSWSIATSPYVVADQQQTSTVYIKAVDRAGNERIHVFPPQRLFTGYEKAALLSILIVVVFLWQMVWGRRFEKKL